MIAGCAGCSGAVPVASASTEQVAGQEIDHVLQAVTATEFCALAHVVASWNLSENAVSDPTYEPTTELVCVSRDLFR